LRTWVTIVSRRGSLLKADSFWSAKLTADSFYGYTDGRNFWLAASVFVIKA
jgi:hypothetical protein